MRVIGSTTTLVYAHALRSPGRPAPRAAARTTGSARRAPDLVDAGGHRVRRDAGRGARRPAPRRACRGCARRRTRRPRGAARRTASWCPRSSARCSRCTDARRRSASWCLSSTGRSDRARRSPVPCTRHDTGTSPCVPPRRRTPRRTGRRRSWRAAGTGRESARRRRRAGGPRRPARAGGRRSGSGRSWR